MNNARENQNKTLASDLDVNHVFDLVLVDMVASFESERLVCVKRNMYEAGSSYKYVCVSYRWGEYTEQIVLTPDYNAHVTSFAIADLITLCGQILLWNHQEYEKEPDDDDDDIVDNNTDRYLWVDAISVDQMNHANKKSTTHRMTEIYNRAELIIAVPDLHIGYLMETPNNHEFISTLSRHAKKIYHHITLQCTNKKGDDEEDVKSDQVGQENLDVQKPEKYQHAKGGRGSRKHRKFRQFVKDTIRQLRLLGGADGTQKKNDAAQTNLDDDDDDFTVSSWEDTRRTQRSNRCLCAVGMTQTEKEDYIRALRYLAHVVNDWANRVWVMNECSIERRSKIKLWFLSISYNVGFDDRSIELLDLFNESRPTRFDQPLKERSFLDMMLNSKAARNEDRFYAILPLFKAFKHYVDDHDISNWGITDHLSVRPQLFRMVKLQEKLAILLSCTIAGFSSDVVLPSFVSNYNHLFFKIACDLSYRPSLLNNIELLKDEDINRDYLRITVPWSRTFTDKILSHDLGITQDACGKLGLNTSELVTVFMPIIVHDERTNHTLGVKLLGSRKKIYGSCSIG
ncbi:uncharacterized protein BX664DRAFT_369288 [Halteromyces radiatus]|uniref:uncharacterized protein n=1 Tax=Halteromyces radiatus TaxID=101107 RepID=UPI002220BC53|nr:uncharacterized protein BX664DRAFT_369288 [Halteromyces radiatus]KAI8078884.1 hypothetical protein BX664DRAFT_369288 [Halteromyces radiatus]